MAIDSDNDVVKVITVQLAYSHAVLSRSFDDNSRQLKSSSHLQHDIISTSRFVIAITVPFMTASKSFIS